MTKTTKKGIKKANSTLNINFDVNVNMNTFFQLYRKNSTLSAAIDEKAKNVGRNGYKVIKRMDNGQILEITDQSVYDFLNYGNDLNDKKDQLITNLDVSGNNYYELIKNTKGQTIGFQSLDPRGISIISDKYGNIYKYVQNVNGDGVEFLPEEIQHDKDKIDLDNPLIGLSKVETLVYDLLGDKEASKSNYGFFKNNGIPSQLVILDTPEMDDSQLDEDDDDEGPSAAQLVTDQLIKSFSGGENAHKFMVAEGIKDIKSIGTTNQDMEYREYRAFNVERICSVLSVPKTELNYTEGVNYSNAETQHDKFIEGTIQPLARKVSGIYTRLLRQAFPNENYEFIFENDLGKIYKEKAELNKILTESGQITLNEARMELNREKYTNEFADEPLINKNLIMLKDVDLSAVSTTPAPTE